MVRHNIYLFKREHLLKMNSIDLLLMAYGGGKKAEEI
jgi:hypothetical protein